MGCKRQPPNDYKVTDNAGHYRHHGARFKSVADKIVLPHTQEVTPQFQLKALLMVSGLLRAKDGYPAM